MANTAELEVVEAPDRATWRAWLAGHHGRVAGAWLVLQRGSTIDSPLTYEAAVEEALCFGWIDSRSQPMADGRHRQHFAPRKPGGTWARSNKERIERLEREGRMTEAGRQAVDAARLDGSWTALDEIDALMIPDDLAAAFAANPAADAKFEAFSPSAKRAYLWWIKSARRPGTRTQRIDDTIWLAEQGIRIPQRRT